MPILTSPQPRRGRTFYDAESTWKQLRPGIFYPTMRWHPDPRVQSWFIRRFRGNTLTPFLYLQRRGPWLYRL